MFKKFVIYGLGVSGFWASIYLAKKGFKVVLTDDNDSSIDNARKKINESCAEFSNYDVEFVSSSKIENFKIWSKYFSF